MANTKVLIKRSNSTSTPTTLSAGELAYSYASNTLFIGTSDGSAALSIGGKSLEIFAQNAFNQANTATNNAASASLYANTGINNAASASAYANTGINNAASASLYANTGINNAASASEYANTGITIGGAAFNKANDANSLAQAAFDVANSASSSSTDQYARDTANSAGIYANTAINDAASASAYANTGINNAASASLYANTGINNAASASLYANAGITLAQAAYDTANGVQFSLSADSGSGTVANNGTLTITGGQGITSNVSGSTVTLDVDDTVVRSNTSSIGPQTISTSLTIGSNNDLIVTGNLIINGNITSQNVQSLEVADPLLLLGVGNYVSDTKDIGFAAHYNNGTNAHTGLIRDANTDKEWYFFEGYTGVLDANNNIDINDASFSTANVHANYFKGNLIADTAVVAGLDITSYIQIDGVNVLPYINAAFDKANTANVLAQNAYNQANTATNNAASASSYANTGINNAASASAYANAGITLAQAAYDQGNSTATVANTAVNNAASASLYANTGVTLAQAAFNQANTTQTFAVGGLFTQVQYQTGKGNAISVGSATGALANYLSTLTNGSLLAMRFTNSSSGKIYNGYFTLSSTVGASPVGFATVSSWTPFVSGGNNPITDGATFTDSTTAEVYTDIYLARNSRVNDVTILAQAAFDVANSAASGSTDQYARDTANSAGIYANTGINNAASASLYANTGINNAASASLYANNAINDAASAGAYANTGITIAGAAFTQANAANSLAQAAFDAANNVTSTFDIAGDAGSFNFATGSTLTLIGGDGITTDASVPNQVSINVDNTVIRTTGVPNQTINGSLAITGDLVVSGNTVTTDVQTIVVQDSLIHLAANNDIADTLDIGFFGEYASSGVKYTALMRDATDGKYKVLVNGTEEPSAGNTVNVAAFTTGTLVANIEAGSISTSTLTATGLSYLASPGSTDGIVYVDSAGVIKYSFTVDGGTF
jgi:hypothetical protein